MEITLEKIELVKDRTGVTYKEAKEALEATDGNVVEAIISIEETINLGARGRVGAQGAQITEKIKAAVRKGNVSKIIVRKDDQVILNLPVNVSIVGAVLAPWAAAAGVVAAFGTKCTIELVKDDGDVVEISETLNDTFGEAARRGADIAAGVREKGADIFDNVLAKTHDALEKAGAAKERDDRDGDDFAEADGYVSTSADSGDFGGTDNRYE